MKLLYLSSVLVVLFFGCAPTHGYKLSKEVLVTNAYARPIINKDRSLLYKTTIRLYNKYYSGLIVLKQTDSVTAHLVFVTELGMKMFDFEIVNNDFRLVYVFKPLNKPKYLKLLEKDMKLMLLQNLVNKPAKMYVKGSESVFAIANGKEKEYYFADSTYVNRSCVKGRIFKKQVVTYDYSDSATARAIRLKHKGLLRLRIELNNISKETE